MLRRYRTHTLRILIASMTVIAIALTTSIILLLYRTAYQETLIEMGHGAQRFASLLDAMSQADAKRNPDHKDTSWHHTMRQLEAGILKQPQHLAGREITIGQRSGTDMLLFLAQPQQGLQQVARVPFDGKLARPMFLALQGKTGTGELLDYAGSQVLAGYAPVPSLDLGIVYKVDKSAVQAPFVRASLWAGGIALGFIALGAWLFGRITNPLLRRTQEVQQRYTNLVNNARVTVFETDRAGQCTFVNHYWHEMTGITLDQSLGEGWMRALHADDREQLLQAWQVFIREQQPFNQQFRVVHIDGRVHWAYAQATAMRDTEGRLLGFSGTVTDISDTISARAALQDSEAHLREAQRLAQLGSWELDLNSNKLTWSDEIFRIFEIDKNRFGASYEAFLNAIHPEDRDLVNRAYSESVANHTPYEIDHRLQMPDGRIKWVKERCATFYDATGRPLRSAGTVQDISERMLIERELNAFKSTLDQTLDCVFIFDAQTLRFIYVNQGAIEQVGYSKDELLIMTPVDIKPEIDASTFTAMIAPLRSGEVNELRFTTIHRHKRGHDIPVSILLQHVQVEEAGARFIAIVRDITIQQRAEQELQAFNQRLEKHVADRTRELEFAKEQAERANRAKSEFLSRMSHELRTPMNAILGFAQVLETENLRPEQLDFANEIHRAGKHLLQLIDELLDLSRIESGRMSTLLQPVLVNRVVNDALQITHSLLAGKNVRCHNQCPVPHAVLADETRLKQILVNLLSNAAKYSGPAGEVILACEVRADNLRISIRDQGPGIPLEKMPLLFKPFERLGAEHSGVDGTGIGLALSKQLAELMGGSMGCDSMPGQGATFWIELPAAIVDHVAPAVVGAEIHATSSFTVLYVEDNAANLKVIEALFRQQTHLQLISATNGEYGLELAKRYVPDAILLDIHLPGLDGYGVLEALQADAVTKHIPVIALSADAMPLDIENGLKAGFLHYLTKPIKIDDLLSTLHGLEGWHTRTGELHSH